MKIYILNKTPISVQESDNRLCSPDCPYMLNYDPHCGLKEGPPIMLTVSLRNYKTNGMVIHRCDYCLEHLTV